MWEVLARDRNRRLYCAKEDGGKTVHYFTALGDAHGSILTTLASLPIFSFRTRVESLWTESVE